MNDIYSSVVQFFNDSPPSFIFDQIQDNIELLKKLSWNDKRFQVYVRAKIQGLDMQRYIVPSIISTFETTEQAESAYYELQKKTMNNNYNIDNVEYNKDLNEIRIVFNSMVIK